MTTEILIPIPPWAVELWATLCHKSEALSLRIVEYADHIQLFLTNQRNLMWLTISMIVFWPLWVTCAVAVTTASTWIFWLFVSMLLGLVQMVYVTYQLILIATNVFVLTLLKAYAVLWRSRLGQGLLSVFSPQTVKSKRYKTSRRRLWRHQCEHEVSTYDEYLQLPVLEPLHSSNSTSATSTTQQQQTKAPGNDMVSPKRTIKKKPYHNPRRSLSMSHLPALEEHDAAVPTPNKNDKDSPSPTHRSGLLKRMASFDKRRQDDDTKLSLLDDPADPDLVRDLGSMGAELLLATTTRLRQARILFDRSDDIYEQSSSLVVDASSLPYLLSGVVKRNHLTLEDVAVNNARSVAVSGHYETSSTTREFMADFYEEVEKGLHVLAHSPLHSTSRTNTRSPTTCTTHDDNALHRDDFMEETPNPLQELSDRMTLVRKMKQNMGRTALMLSGGGAQAMYHLGTIRALIESKLYSDISVISGTSGGSITAACCAMYTEEELYADICVPTVSTDYRLNGEMKKHNIRWFPPIMDMGAYWLKTRLLVDSEYFYRTCEFYYGNTTFQEAFEKTGKHVCITVSASRASGGTAQRLLLNHISTPHVTLASAVAASCALPGVMKPAKLKTKTTLGDVELFEVDGVEWIDGSVQADLPFQRIATLFNVSNFIVCQTNFHVLPFLNKEHHPNRRSLYWKMFQTMEWDIRNRALKLSRLGLFPRIFGQDISKVFKQKYHGNLTLVPRFTAAQTFGLKALVNPSLKEMEGYLKYGQLAAWPYLGVVRDMIRFEKALDECLQCLKERSLELHPEADMLDTDDLDSIASSIGGGISASIRSRVVKFAGSERQMEKLKTRVVNLEKENRTLRQQISQLQRTSGLRNGQNSSMTHDEKKVDDTRAKVDLTEGAVLQLVRSLDFQDTTFDS